MTLKQITEKFDTESTRFKELADHLIVAAYHKEGGATERDKRLIRDHEVRAETYATAACFICQNL